MKVKRLLTALALGWALAGCASSAAAATADTGVTGVVTVGPTCPVERINSPCPPRRAAAAVIVSDQSGVEVTRFVSGTDGSFKVQLKPGRYTLVGTSNSPGGLPRPIPVNVVVVAGSFTVVNVEFDSGIR